LAAKAARGTVAKQQVYSLVSPITLGKFVTSLSQLDGESVDNSGSPGALLPKATRLARLRPCFGIMDETMEMCRPCPSMAREQGQLQPGGRIVWSASKCPFLGHFFPNSAEVLDLRITQSIAKW
jgi:hypothetical protein